MSALRLTVMQIGLGLAALGRPGYINLDRDAHLLSRTVEGMQSQADAVMDEVLVLASSGSSVPWFDCARSYGLSEKFLGEFLRSRKVSPEDVYVSSKWGYTYVAEWNVQLGEGEKHEIKDHSVENFLKQLQETNENIGEYLNLYQVHSATFDSGILTNVKVHEALRKCREERGWLIGLSVSGENQDELIREAMQIRVNSGDDRNSAAGDASAADRLFDSVQCTYNLLEQRPGPALLEASEAGMDVIIKESLANGRVLQHPKLHEYARKLGCEPDQLALGAVLAQPFRPRVLSGAVTTEQFRSNYKALNVAETLVESKLGKEILKELMDECRMESGQYWKDRSALAWN